MRSSLVSRALLALRPTLRLGGLCLLATACGDPNQTHPERQGYDAGTTLSPLTCIPNLDGKIDPSELEASLGIPASYLASPVGETRAVDLAGTVDSAGKRVWDFSVEQASDKVAKLSASSLAGKWYAASFPRGQFVAAVDLGGSTEGIYLHDQEALWLLGVASSTENPPEGKTLMVYQSPVALYRFPLAPGLSWTSTGKVVNGTFFGLPYAASDTYQVSVDGSGKLLLPDLSFSQVLRVRTDVTLSPAVGRAISRRQVSFLFECFGEVARATSSNDEPKTDFTTAVELRRLGL